MAQYGFYFDMTKCTSCKACVLACSELHDLGVGYNFRKVTNYEGGTFPAVWTAGLSMACNHCAIPACFAVCAVGAIDKDAETGLVTIDTEICIGCRLCEPACPYEVPVFIPDAGIADKCDGCKAYVNEGEKPVCVLGCSTRCLDFGDMDELQQTYGSANLVKDIGNLPDSSTTNPSILIRPRAEMA